MKRMIAPVALVVGVAATHAATASSFEKPPGFKAARILSGASLKGPLHEVAEAVEVTGFQQVFQIGSRFGTIEAEGRTVLRVRLAEIDALDRLAEVSKTEVFAKAAGGAVLDVGKGAVAAVKDPGATAKGIGGGLKRMGANLGRKSKRVAEDVTADSKDEDGEATEAAGNAANSVLGINASAREWAQKLGVDPYTTNPVLHAALAEVGKIDAAGSIATKVVVPIPRVVSTTATVGAIVFGADPEQVRKAIEKGLSDLGVAPKVAGRFLSNVNFTLTQQARFVGSLGKVGVKGCADYVDAAAESERERESLFFVESAEMLAGLHAETPARAILADSRAMIAVVGDTAVALLPFDWLYWTQELEHASGEIAVRAKTELSATALEIRVSGDASAAARKGLSAAGWQLKPGVITGLHFPPAD